MTFGKPAVDFSLLLSLILDHLKHGISSKGSSSVSSELLSGDLHSLLLLGGDSSSDELEHLLLKWGESSDLSDDLSNSLSSLGLLSLEGNWSLFPSLFSWSSNDVTLVESNENAGSVVGFTHVLI